MTKYAHNVCYASFKNNWIVGTPRNKTVLISLLDDDKIQHLPLGSTETDWFDRIALTFDDVDADQPNAMTVEQAENLWQFLKTAIDNNCHVVVHCTAGLCRSGAVVEFLCKYYQYSDVNPVRLPNGHVFGLLEQCAGFEKTIPTGRTNFGWPDYS